jgi:hypothetical protein
LRVRLALLIVGVGACGATGLLVLGLAALVFALSLPGASFAAAEPAEALGGACTGAGLGCDGG